MATLVAITVDTGGTGDYPSMNAAEAANWGASGANITAAGTDEYVECSCICTDGNADTTYADCDGMTTDTTHTIVVDVDSGYRHVGVWPTSGNIYRLTNSLSNCIRCQDDHITFRNLALYQDGGADYKYGLLFFHSEQCTVEYCIAKGNPAATTENVSGFGIYSAYGDLYFANNISYDFKTTHATKSHGIYVDPLGYNVYLYNNTCVDCDTGIEAVSGTVVVKDNLCFNCTTEGDYKGTFAATSTHNGYTNGQSGPTGGSNAIDLGSSGAAIFTDYSGDNFHLLGTSSPAYNVGTTLNPDPDGFMNVTVDIDGDTRAATPCIGADEHIPTVSQDPDVREQLQLKISKWALEGLLQKYAYHP